VAALLQAGAHPVVLGGGHEIAWGSFQGLRRRPGSSGTPFDQIAEYCAARGHALQYACLGVSPLGNTPALYARAAEVGAVWVEDRHMQEAHLGERLAQLDTLLAAAGHVYLTIDLDVLPAATAPGVSAPAPYGVPLAVVEEVAMHVRASGKLRLADLAECNPAYDIDHRTA
ncbi:arginase family protein, partial [Bordetella pertussis]|uniref:arginase family protein n=1 Tax=Bordetella pertussis TaxID=520 RepID=UPI0018A6B59F